MLIRTVIDSPSLVAGITLKDHLAPESNNMALHACSDPEAVLANRRELARSLGTDLEQFVCTAQTHSANVRKVARHDCGSGAFTAAHAIPDTDALYTTENDVLLCSFSADCVPVIFSEEASGVIGTIHSGWQGTVKEITVHTFREVQRTEGTDLGQLQVWIGPAISQQRFEVDKDVEQRFRQLGYADQWITFDQDRGKYLIDNQQVVRMQCLLAGVPAENISVEPFCTYDEPAGFSHRQDKASGRHLSFIMKRV